MIKIDGLKENENNPRTIQSEAFRRLCASIARDPEFMMLRPIVVDDSGVILGGNMRYRAIKKLGMSEIPDGWVVKASNLSEEQKKRFILVDNSPSGMAGDWDYEVLANGWEMSELETLGFDIDDLIIEPPEEEIENNDIFEQSIQLNPQKEYILIFAKDAEEWEEMKEVFKLRQVRRGGYKKGSSFDSVGVERVLTFERVKNVSRDPE